MKIRLWLVAVLAVALSACAATRIGRDFDLKVFEAKAERGKSTQAEVRAWLGAPSGTGTAVDTSGEQFQEWTYYYGEVVMPNGANPRLKLLQVKFDRQGILRAYNWSG